MNRAHVMLPSFLVALVLVAALRSRPYAAQEALQSFSNFQLARLMAYLVTTRARDIDSLCLRQKGKFHTSVANLCSDTNLLRVHL